MLNDCINISSQRKGRPPLDEARQRERAHRILDAAGELILRWGYDKTTIDDVARASDVAKGTIYLHWRTREDLFAALLRRERLDLLRAVRQSLPNGGTLRDLIQRMVAELLARPLMKASLLRDTDVLGKMAKVKRTQDASAELKAGFDRYFSALMQNGALREDLTPAEHLTVIISVVYGFLCVPQLLPPPLALSDERLAELTAETATEATKATPAVLQASLEYLDHAVAAAERKLDESLKTKERVQ
ncbi:TetR/AcrR family transcriptional regulator [Nonomuraea sp. NPDC050556]|uniref:TetR/AcrR family transcriptional regulator n=1 Tax=Nonomuraea sp. NPDC050556 TaxID=3364369 RepID=UPI0037A17D71